MFLLIANYHIIWTSNQFTIANNVCWRCVGNHLLNLFLQIEETQLRIYLIYYIQKRSVCTMRSQYMCALLHSCHGACVLWLTMPTDKNELPAYTYIHTYMPATYCACEHLVILLGWVINKNLEWQRRVCGWCPCGAHSGWGRWECMCLLVQ